MANKMMFYAFLFLALLGTGVGLFPIPEDIIVLSAGAGVQQEVGNIFIVFAVTFAGIIISDTIIFLAGEKIGRRVFEIKFLSHFFPRNKIEKVNAVFTNHSKKSVFIGRFVSGLRPIVLFTAGMSKIKLKNFLIWDVLASIIYIPLLMFLGYRFAYDISRLIGGMKQIYHAIEILIIISIVSWLVFRLSKKLFNNNKSLTT